MSKLTEQQKKEIHDKFKLIDKDNSGYLDSNELKGAIKDILGQDVVSDEAADTLMKNIDTNNDGKINLEEFEKYLAEKGVPK